MPTDNGEGRAPPVSEDEAPRLAPRHQLRPRNQGVFFAVTDNGEGRAPPASPPQAQDLEILADVDEEGDTIVVDVGDLDKDIYRPRNSPQPRRSVARRPRRESSESSATLSDEEVTANAKPVRAKPVRSRPLKRSAPKPAPKRSSESSRSSDDKYKYDIDMETSEDEGLADRAKDEGMAARAKKWLAEAEIRRQSELAERRGRAAEGNAEPIVVDEPEPPPAPVKRKRGRPRKNQPKDAPPAPKPSPPPDAEGQKKITRPKKGLFFLPHDHPPVFTGYKPRGHWPARSIASSRRDTPLAAAGDGLLEDDLVDDTLSEDDGLEDNLSEDDVLEDVGDATPTQRPHTPLMEEGVSTGDPIFTPQPADRRPTYHRPLTMTGVPATDQEMMMWAIADSLPPLSRVDGGFDME